MLSYVATLTVGIVIGAVVPSDWWAAAARKLRDAAVAGFGKARDAWQRHEAGKAVKP